MAHGVVTLLNVRGVEAAINIEWTVLEAPPLLQCQEVARADMIGGKLKGITGLAEGASLQNAVLQNEDTGK